VRIGWSWPAFVLYVLALSGMTLGGFLGLVEYGHPAFLAPVLMGLFFFYITWKIVAEEDGALPPPSRQR
jgi:hypothetical protein